MNTFKLDNLKEVFFLFAENDRDGMPTISIKQLKFMNDEMNLGLTENELDAEFDKVAMQGDENPTEEEQQPDVTIEKRLTYEQFYAMMKNLLSKTESYETVRKGLTHLDKEGKGLLDARYFRFLLDQYANDGEDKWDAYDIEELIKTMDPDKTGKIDIKELCDVAFLKEKPRAAKPKEPEKGKKGAKGGKKK
jgi:Ca2+-binding EF-hand superfamily protein